MSMQSQPRRRRRQDEEVAKAANNNASLPQQCSVVAVQDDHHPQQQQTDLDCGNPIRTNVEDDNRRTQRQQRNPPLFPDDPLLTNHVESSATTTTNANNNNYYYYNNQNENNNCHEENAEDENHHHVTDNNNNNEHSTRTRNDEINNNTERNNGSRNDPKEEEKLTLLRAVVLQGNLEHAQTIMRRTTKCKTDTKDQNIAYWYGHVYPITRLTVLINLVVLFQMAFFVSNIMLIPIEYDWMVAADRASRSRTSSSITTVRPADYFLPQFRESNVDCLLEVCSMVKTHLPNCRRRLDDDALLWQTDFDNYQGVATNFDVPKSCQASWELLMFSAQKQRGENNGKCDDGEDDMTSAGNGMEHFPYKTVFHLTNGKDPATDNDNDDASSSPQQSSSFATIDENCQISLAWENHQAKYDLVYETAPPPTDHRHRRGNTSYRPNVLQEAFCQHLVPTLLEFQSIYFRSYWTLLVFVIPVVFCSFLVRAMETIFQYAGQSLCWTVVLYCVSWIRYRREQRKVQNRQLIEQQRLNNFAMGKKEGDAAKSDGNCDDPKSISFVQIWLNVILVSYVFSIGYIEHVNTIHPEQDDEGLPPNFWWLATGSLFWPHLAFFAIMIVWSLVVYNDRNAARGWLDLAVVGNGLTFVVEPQWRRVVEWWMGQEWSDNNTILTTTASIIFADQQQQQQLHDLVQTLGEKLTWLSPGKTAWHQLGLYIYLLYHCRPTQPKQA